MKFWCGWSLSLSRDSAWCSVCHHFCLCLGNAGIFFVFCTRHSPCYITSTIATSATAPSTRAVPAVLSYSPSPLPVSFIAMMPTLSLVYMLLLLMETFLLVLILTKAKIKMKKLEWNWSQGLQIATLIFFLSSCYENWTLRRSQILSAVLSLGFSYAFSSAKSWDSGGG